MTSHDRSNKSPSKEGWFVSFAHVILSFYADLISRPFQSGLVYIIAGLIPALIIGWFIFPMVLYSKQQQPVNFSHALHLDPDMGIIEGDTEVEKCLYCHSFRDDGTFAGVPRLDQCTECHDDPESPLGESEYEKKFLEEYVANETEIPWLIYSKQPDCVYFSHIAHVKMGEMECKTCHGDYAKSEQMPVYKRNRISGYSIDIWGRNIAGVEFNTWDAMKMDDCAECHTKTGHEEDNACFVCHK